MINQDDKGDLKWRNFADYDLGRTYKYKVKSKHHPFFNPFSQAARVWPLEKQRTRSTPQVAPKKNLTFYEASGLQKCGDVEKSSTILQYFLEGRIQTGLLNLVSVKSRYQSKLSEGSLFLNLKTIFLFQERLTRI